MRPPYPRAIKYCNLYYFTNNENNTNNIRNIKKGIENGLQKVNQYLDEAAVEVEGDMLENVSSISCNNDKELGKIISQAYSKVGKDGVVLMEESETEKTNVEFVEGF